MFESSCPKQCKGCVAVVGACWVMLPISCQVCNGLVQTTGWPAVVACVGNWFGKGK